MIRSGRGFTLLEVLLAVTLLAILMALIYGVVVSTVQAQQRIDAITHGSEIGPAILNQIRQDLTGAFLPDSLQDYFVGQDRKQGYGDGDRVDFISSVMAYGTETSMSRPMFHSVNEVGYQVAESPDHPGELILYRRLDLFVDAEALQAGRLAVLADRVLSFNIEYRKKTEWVTTWISSQAEHTLPDAVKVELKMRVPDASAKEGTVERTYATIVALVKQEAVKPAPPAAPQQPQK
ncbi:MAG: prepilin-type N-terminal cleavage/methylation domain-containing protein [Planctomycetes bacterium]|nr:prepilin-type N-terminal cleavage/methylation domain-containing protein [Planctomycetota bacterium]